MDLPKLLSSELKARLEQRQAQVVEALDVQLQGGDTTYGFHRVRGGAFWGVGRTWLGRVWGGEGKS